MQLLSGFLFVMLVASPLFTDSGDSIPSATPSTCPTREAMLITPTGPIPSSTSFPHGLPTIFATVLVTVNPDGSVKSAKILRSSGFSNTDDFVLNRARTSRYQPKMVGCSPVEGTYIFLDVVEVL